jgi:hypothetical protein
MKMPRASFRFVVLSAAYFALAGCDSPPLSDQKDGGTNSGTTADKAADNDMNKKAELESAISSELPNGSDADAVFAFLKVRNIEHSKLIDQADQKHMGKNPNEKIISAIIRDTQKGAFVSGNLAITFRFDQSDKLVGSLVENVNTGP